MPKKVSLKQRKWAKYFVELGNGAEAARKAGYCEKYANRISSANQNKPHVMALVNEQLKKIEDASIAKAEEVMKYLTSVVRGEQQEEVIVVEGTGNGISKAKKIVKELQPKDRLKAAELLAKRYGLLTDKIDLTGDMELQIKIDYGDN